MFVFNLDLFQLGSHISAFGTQQQQFTTTPVSSSSTSSHGSGRDNHESSSPQMPIRPIPFHSGTSQPVFLNPSELMKNLQSKLCSLRGNTGETHESNSNSPLGSLVPTSVISLSSNSNNMMTNNSNQILSSSQSVHNNNVNGNSTRISPDQIIPSHFLEQRIRTRSETSSPASSNESPQLDSHTSLSPVPFLQGYFTIFFSKVKTLYTVK